MRSRKSQHARESADSDESEKTVNSSDSEDDTASSDEEVTKKSKKRRKQSSSSDSDSGDSHHRRSKKKKHKKKKRKHSKKHRRQRSNDDESDTNEELSSEPAEESPPKKKRKHKHKQKHSKKVHTEKYESEEEKYAKRQASATEEELILSSDGGRPENSAHRTATKDVHKSYKSSHSHSNQRSERYHAAGHSRQRGDEIEAERFYRGSSKDRPRRVEAFVGGRSAREVPPVESLIDPRYIRGHNQRDELLAKYAQYGHVQPPKRIEPLMASHRYETKEQYPPEQYNVNKDFKRGNRNENYPQRYNNGRERDDIPKFDRFTENNQANRYEGERYRQVKEDNYKMDRNNSRGFDNANRDNRYGDNRRDYSHQPNRNVEIKSLMPEKYDRHDNLDSKPGTSGQDSRHYRNNHPVRERMPLPTKREESQSETRHHNPRYAHQTSRHDRPNDRVDRNNGSNNKGNKLYDRNERHNDRNYSHNDRNAEKNDRHDSRQERKKSDSSYMSRQTERKGRKDDKADDRKSYDWGKKEESDVKKEKADREKPNFGLSGKLTEDTNLVNGVVLKYTPPDDARQPKRRWRFYPFKGDKALPILYIHRQPFFLLGRDRRVADIPLDHPSVSKQHAVLQYRMVNFTRDDGTTGRKIRPYIIDLESANGTFVNNKKVEPRKYVELLERDVVKFGFSQREYVLLHENSKDDALDDDVKPNLEDVDIKKES